MADEGSDDTGNTLYRTDCPICGASSLHLEEPGARGSSAVDYLRAHVRSTPGDGHGPEHALPDDLDEEVLEDHVTPV